MRWVLLPTRKVRLRQVTLLKARQLANEIWLKFRSRQSDPTVLLVIVMLMS